MNDLIGPQGRQIDKNEVMFILGYDLLNDKLKAISSDIDVIYSICGDLVIDFAYSEYNDSDYSLYDCLSRFVENCLLYDNNHLYKKLI